jgi:hypothetical protein
VPAAAAGVRRLPCAAHARRAPYALTATSRPGTRQLLPRSMRRTAARTGSSCPVCAW